MKNKISYEIKSVTPASASSEMLHKIMMEAKGKKYVLIKKEGDKEEGVFYSDSKIECDNKRVELEKLL